MSMFTRLSNAWRIGCFTLVAAGLFAAGRLTLPSSIVSAAQGAPPAKGAAHEEGHSDAQFEAALRKAMDGPVDVFVDMVEVQEQKPLLPGVRFDGLVDVTGKHLLGFSDGANKRWLIDPDAVLAFRVSRGKAK
jgi:hypothetical protein